MMKKHFKSICLIISILLLVKVINYLSLILSNIIFDIPLFKNIHSNKLGMHTSITALIFDIILFIVLFFIFIKRGGLFNYVKLNCGYSYKKLKFIIPSVWVAMLIGGIFSLVSIKLFGGDTHVHEIFNNMLITPIGIIEGVIIAPIVEEILLRGILFNKLKKDYSLKISIVLQAGVFAILHGNITQGCNAFVGGILFAIIYLYTGSLWGDITAHMLTNATVVLSVILNTNYQWIITILFPIIVIISFVIVFKYYRKDVLSVLRNQTKH